MGRPGFRRRHRYQRGRQTRIGKEERGLPTFQYMRSGRGLELSHLALPALNFDERRWHCRQNVKTDQDWSQQLIAWASLCSIWSVAAPQSASAQTNGDQGLYE